MTLIERLLSQAVWNEGDAGAAGGAGDAGAAVPAMQQMAGDIAAQQQNAGAGDAGGEGDGAAGEGQGAQDDAAAAAAAAADAAADGGQGQQGAKQYLPDGLPEDLRGETDQQTIDRLVEKLNAQPHAPEKPEDYSLTLSDEQQARYGDLESDPVHKALREVLHGEGASNEMFQNVFTKMHDRLTEMGVLETIDPKAELAKLAPQSGDQTERDAAAGKRVTDATNGIKDLATTLQLSQAQTNVLLAGVDTAESVIAWEKVLAATRGKGAQGGGDPPIRDNRTPQEKALAKLYPSHSKGN